MTRRERLGLGQRHIAIGIEQPNGMVEMVEVDNQLVEDALMMLGACQAISRRFSMRPARVFGRSAIAKSPGLTGQF